MEKDHCSGTMSTAPINTCRFQVEPDARQMNIVFILVYGVKLSSASPNSMNRCTKVLEIKVDLRTT